MSQLLKIIWTIFMKQTSDDSIFAKEFARQLRPKYAEQRKKKPNEPKVKFDQEFAKSLGVDRAALWKYLNSKEPPTPSIRTIVLAYKEYRIAVRYGSVDTKTFLNKGRRAKL